MAKKPTAAKPANPLFTVLQPTLNKALQTCSKALSDNKIIPVCEMFLFDLSASDGTLHISACDLQISISTRVDIHTTTGKWPLICIPGRKLADYIGKSANEALMFELETHVTPATDPERAPEIAYSILITSSTGKLSLPTEPGDDFPSIKIDGDLQTFDLPISEFSQMISRTLYAVSDDQLRPAATGLNIATTHDLTGLSVTGCAWNYIATFSFPISLPVPVNIIIPKSALQTISGMMGATNTGNMQFGICKRSAQIDFGTVSFRLLLIDERFPDVQSVIPTGNDINLTLNRATLAAAIKRIAPFTDAGKLVKLSISGMWATLTAQNIDYSETATETISAQFDGGEVFEIGLSSDQIAPILNSLTSETVFFSFSTPRRAMVITDGIAPVPGLKENLVLLMPLFLPETV